MKKYFLLPLLLLPLNQVFTQNFSKKIQFSAGEQEVILENPVLAPDPFTALSVIVFSENAVSLEFSTAAADRQFSDWKILPEDPHLRTVERRAHGLFFLEKTIRWLKFRLAERPAADLSLTAEVHFFNPAGGGSSPFSLATNPPEESGAACDCPLPTFRSRAEWCTVGTCSPVSAPVTTTVTHLIVHHSAGANTAMDWNAVVTSIWSFHVNSNLWADIGYNWLIAPDGTLFQGRGDNVSGAHFCGTNAGTMGVCLLGTYTDVGISAAAQRKLLDLLSWKACVRNLNPTATAFHSSSGLNLGRISGHRDGCATECPGNMFYATLPALRDSVAARLAACHVSISTDDFSEISFLKIFPNPVPQDADGQFFIQIGQTLAAPAQFSIFDATTGQICQKIDLQNAGQYSVKLGDGAARRGLFFWQFRGRSGKLIFE